MRHRLRLLFFLFFGALLSGGILFWLFQTTDGAHRMLRLALEKGLSLQDLRLGTISGNLGHILEISHLSGVLNKTRVKVSLQDVKLDASWLKSLTHAPYINRIEVGRVQISGIPDPLWLKRLPPPPTWGAFAGVRLPVILKELRIGRLECGFSASSPWRIWASDLVLNPPVKPEVATSQAISFQAGIGTIDQDLSKMGFQGWLNQKTGIASGTLSGQLCGGTFSSEINWNFGRSPETVSGFLHQGEWNLALLNRWLFPLWQERFPALFEGFASLSGSWLVSKKVGLLGNLNAEVRKFNCHVVPLPMPVFEFSGKLSFAEGVLMLQEPDLTVLGSPGKISAEIGLHSWETPVWKVLLEVPSLDLGSFTSQLPWVVRYSFGLVPLSGEASLTLNLGGVGPEIMCVARVPGLQLNSQAGKCTWEGHMDYRRGPVGGERFHAEWSWVASDSLNPLPRLLRRNAGGLFQNPVPPFSGRGKLTGTTHGSSFEGGFQAGNECREIRGTWLDGHWAKLESGESIPTASGTGVQTPVHWDLAPPVVGLAMLVNW